MTKGKITILSRKPKSLQWAPMILNDATYLEDFMGETELPLGIYLRFNDEIYFGLGDANVLLRTEDASQFSSIVCGTAYLTAKNDNDEIVSLSSKQMDWIYKYSHLLYMGQSSIPVCQLDLREGGF